MFVRKFEADSLEEALKDIKKELGPDAIILKTVTNKGIKGAFKKKKIEITAAISEKSIVKKNNVDRALGDGTKEKFYQADAAHIGKMINQFDENTPKGGYGNLALNKKANTIPAESIPARSGLQEFLGNDEEEDFETKITPVKLGEKTSKAKSSKPSPRPASHNNFEIDQEETLAQDIVSGARANQPKPATKHSDATKEKEYDLSMATLDKITELERKIIELTKNVETREINVTKGLFQLRNTLRSLDIDHSYVHKLLQKLQYELPVGQLENSDLVFEYALKEMLTVIKTSPANFSKEECEGSQITVLFSEAPMGQTTTIKKLATLKQNSVIIQYNPNKYNAETPKTKDESVKDMSGQIFNFETIEATSLHEVLGICRKKIESSQDVFLDLRVSTASASEVKLVIDSLRRSFAHVESWVTISAIHSEVYNRRVMNNYAAISDGIVVTNLDQCLGYGQLFNLAYAFNKVPFKFFTTGEVIPDDIEAATAERILAGIFNL